MITARASSLLETNTPSHSMVICTGLISSVPIDIDGALIKFSVDEKSQSGFIGDYGQGASYWNPSGIAINIRICRCIRHGVSLMNTFSLSLSSSRPIVQTQQVHLGC
jgi:hypothetical protein